MRRRSAAAVDVGYPDPLKFHEVGTRDWPGQIRVYESGQRLVENIVNRPPLILVEPCIEPVVDNLRNLGGAGKPSPHQLIPEDLTKLIAVMLVLGNQFDQV